MFSLTLEFRNSSTCLDVQPHPVSGVFPSAHSSLSLGHCLVFPLIYCVSCLQIPLVVCFGSWLYLLAPLPFPLWFVSLPFCSVCRSVQSLNFLTFLPTNVLGHSYSYLSWDWCRLQVRYTCWDEHLLFPVFFLLTHVNLNSDPTSLQFIR